MSSGLLVVLKGIRRNSMYYLKGSAVTGLASSECLDGDSTKAWISCLEFRSSSERCIDLPFEIT